MRASHLIVLGAVILILAVGMPRPARAVEDAAAATPTDGVVVYYFHGDVRCATCRKLEAYTDEAIRGGFADELHAGDVIFRAVNVDQAANKHFIRDFQLTTKAVVLVEYADGKVARHANLTRVWELVRDKERFVGYVRQETRKFLVGA